MNAVMAAELSPAVDVSVLVPVRQEAAGIAEAVSAMRAQTFPGEELARADGRIRVLDNPHGGIPQELKIGVRQARGRFIARNRRRRPIGEPGSCTEPRILHYAAVGRVGLPTGPRGTHPA